LLQKPCGAARCEVKCEEPSAFTTAPAAVAALGSKTPESPVRRLFGLTAALLTCSTLVALWASAFTMPFMLLAALVTQRWGVAGALAGLFALPHLVPIPRVPFVGGVMLAAVKRWQGPPGTCRFLDFSFEEGLAEPEPEPASAASKSERMRRQMFCYHPHGISSVGVLLLTEQMPNLRVCGGPVLYHFAPLFRFGMEGLLGIKFGSVRPADLHGYMKKGESPLMMVPGGFHEATITCPGHERVFLKHRKGFVKYALRYGYDLVPVYTIGEADLMANAQGGWGWRFWLNGLGIPAVLPFGFPLFPLFPRRGVELVTAVGPPVKMPRIAQPSDEDVSEHHRRYMAEVQKLYDRMKKGTASEGRKLEIW